MKMLLLSAFAGLMLLGCQLSGQNKIHVNDCVWIYHSIGDGPDGQPVDNYEIGPGPDGYYQFFTDESETVLLMEGELGNGLRQGTWKFYHTNGTIYCRCHYVNGQLNGLYELFNHDGLVTTSIEMWNDSPVENH